MDILVLRKEDNIKFETSVYRKPTFSGVFTNFTSFLNKSYKFGIIFALLFRSYSICSSDEKFRDEINFLRDVFRKNAYPLSFFNKCVAAFMSKLVLKKVIRVDEVPKKEITVVLPYLGKLSLEIRSRICKTVSRSLGCRLRVIFQSTNRLRNLFSVKDKIPVCMRSYILYKFTCKGCNAIYYGKSERHFHVRACEHLGISHLTGNMCKTPKITAVSEHMTSSKHAGNIDDFTIIGGDNSKSNFRLLIKESLLISRDRPSLNRTIQSFPLELF